MVSWMKPSPSRTHLLLLTVKADISSLVSQICFLSCFFMNTSPLLPLAPTAHICPWTARDNPHINPQYKMLLWSLMLSDYMDVPLASCVDTSMLLQPTAEYSINTWSPSGHKHITDWLIQVKPNLHTRRASYRLKYPACASCNHDVSAVNTVH